MVVEDCSHKNFRSTLLRWWIGCVMLRNLSHCPPSTVQLVSEDTFGYYKPKYVTHMNSGTSVDCFDINVWVY